MLPKRAQRQKAMRDVLTQRRIFGFENVRIEVVSLVRTGRYLGEVDVMLRLLGCNGGAITGSALFHHHCRKSYPTTPRT